MPTKITVEIEPTEGGYIITIDGQKPFVASTPAQAGKRTGDKIKAALIQAAVPEKKPA